MEKLSFSIQNLLKLDTRLKLISGDCVLDDQITGLCDLSNLDETRLLFIKDKKFLAKVLEDKYFTQKKALVFIISQKIYNQLDEEQIKIIFSFTKLCLTTDCMDSTLNTVSKYFYDELYIFHDALVDGRQMSTTQIHPTANIAQNVTIGSNVKIAQNVTIHSGAIIMANVIIEKDTIIFPNVTLYPYVKIGTHCRIHSSTVIGADGFGYNFKDGVHLKVWHMGGVHIGDHVEIGANSCIDTGTFSPTVIEDGCKLDNHVQIGHNCFLGKGVVICGHVGVGGSSEIGDFTVFGGKSAMGNGHKIGKACQVAGGALVNSDWPDGSVLGGHPARNLKEWMRGLAFVRKESLKKNK